PGVGPDCFIRQPAFVFRETGINPIPLKVTNNGIFWRLTQELKNPFELRDRVFHQVRVDNSNATSRVSFLKFQTGLNGKLPGNTSRSKVLWPGGYMTAFLPRRQYIWTILVQDVEHGMYHVASVPENVDKQ